MSFLYYFPGHGQTKGQLTRQDVSKTFAREALWDVIHTQQRFAQHTITAVTYHGGPDKGVGTLLACVQTDPSLSDFKVGYFPAEQTWQKLDGAWLGWYNYALPKPEHLRRLQPISGEYVELADGNNWEAPIIQWGPPKTTLLPSLVMLQDDDTITTEVVPEFADFDKLADQIWDHYFQIEGKTLTSAGVLKATIKCLNLNYRIGRPEVRALRLLDSDNWREVFRASNNFRLMEEVLAEDAKKKSVPNVSDLSAGHEDSTTQAEASQNSTLQPSV